MNPEVWLVSTGIGLFAVASGLAILGLVRPGDRQDRGVSALLVLGAIPLVAVLLMHGWQLRRIPVFSRFDAMLCYAYYMVGKKLD